MRAKAKDLIFISQINRDGSGTTPVDKQYVKHMKTEKLYAEEFLLIGLSMSQRTYIASGFNSFVVRITKRGWKRIQKDREKRAELLKLLKKLV